MIFKIWHVNICFMKITSNYYIFKIEDTFTSAINIFQIFNNQKHYFIDKSKIMYALGLKSNFEKNNFGNILQVVEQINANMYNEMQNILKKLQDKWISYEDEYFKLIKQILGLEGLEYDNRSKCTCYLRLLPINEIAFEDNTLFVGYNKNVEILFAKFVTLLTKTLILDKWRQFNDWEWDYEYREDNKIWMFVEIAIDAIFANSVLKKISTTPSYNYLYELRINDINIMSRFRELYNKISLQDFLNEVFVFVTQNYEALSKFRKFLC